MKIKDKLYELWCPNNVMGKTISKIHKNGYGDTVLGFSDGTYFCREEPEELMETYQFQRGEDVDEHPLVIIGVLNESEVDKYWQDWEISRESNAEELRRADYERLKQEFEKENA